MKIIGIVRSIGERTENFSIYLLKKQIDNVYLVKNVKPMKNMSLECLKIGMQSNADYMITCDADVFILPNMVNFMVKTIQKHKRSLITGYTKSKFFGKREGGIRIWKISKMKNIFDLLIKSNEIDTYRPEAFIHTNLNGLLITDITSYHEYEQYYKDIYDKFINQSIKSKAWVNFVGKFRNNKDMDFKVAYHGYFDKKKNFKKSFPNLKEKKDINIKKLKRKMIL